MIHFSPLLPQTACYDRQCLLTHIPGHTQLGAQSPHSTTSPGPQASCIQLGDGAGDRPQGFCRSSVRLVADLAEPREDKWVGPDTGPAGMGTSVPPGLGLGILCLCRYNSLSILPAALGKPVRDVASKVCGSQDDTWRQGGGIPWGPPSEMGLDPAPVFLG